MKRRPGDSAIHAAAFGAAVLIAGQVAGKATRDAFFLSHFSVTALPLIVIVSSLLSIAAGLFAARLLRIFPPGKLLPRAFMLSAAFLMIEWGLSLWSPPLAAALIYLHVTILGSVLISGFWSLIDERFDPRSAKRQFGGIVGASTVGGIIGGLLAGRLGFTTGVATMLPVLAFLHVISAFIAACLGSRSKAALSEPANREQAQSNSGIAVLRTVPYVRNLASLILFSTMGAGLLDYVFKARVTAAYPDANDLVTFFAMFYTAAGVGTFLVQLILSRVAVERFGIAGSVGSLPFSLTAGSLGALLLPGLPAVSAMRGGETMIRSSLFKSGYEMLCAAMPRRERQAAKSILDVGIERLGDLLGAVLVATIAWVASPTSSTIVLVIAAALGLAAFVISQRLRKGYVSALENSLRSRSLSVPQTLRRPARGVSLLMTIRDFATGKPPQAKPLNLTVPQARPETLVRDPIVLQTQALRSSNAGTVRAALNEAPGPVLAPYVIALLAWDEVSAEAMDALGKMGPKITGQLVDSLVDPDQEFAIRRRIPRVLANFNSQRAVDGLVEGLSDSRFEVRYHCAEALAQIEGRSPHLIISPEVIIRTVERELDVNPEVWRHYRVLDSTRQISEGMITIDHIFRLLALVHAQEPLQIAYRALNSRDEHLRQTSLEYLENVLPYQVWQRILPLFEEGTRLASVG